MANTMLKHTGASVGKSICEYECAPLIKEIIENSKNFNKTDYVLGEWTDKEKDDLSNIISSSLESTLSFIHNGIEQTMNIHNTKNLIDENI